MTSRDAVAAADAEVVGPAAARLDRLQGEEVGLRQVVDVDVVADARPVGRRVVGAEHLDGRAAAQRGLEDERDQVRLGVVVLAEVARTGWPRRR